MKKLFLYAACLLCLLNTGKASIIYDITTGWDQVNGQLLPVATPDDDWVLTQIPGSAPYAPYGAWVANGGLWSPPNNYDYTSWGTPPTCGRHLCPRVIPTGEGYYYELESIPSTDPAQDYVYQLEFEADNCWANPRFNISAFGVDNIISMKLNGTSYPIASVPINNLIVGTNTLEVRVKNTGAATGFYLCGAIEGDMPAITPVVTSASLFCQGDPLTFNGSTSTGPVQNYFWEIAECNAQGNYTGAVWNQWYSGFPGSITFGHFIGFIPVCGQYYRVKLAVNNNCVQWEETTTIFFIECPPRIITQTPEPICEGSRVTLTVTGNAVSYIWQPGNLSGTSIVVSPSTTTTYTVTGTGANGCTASVPVVVTVAPANLDLDISTGMDANGSIAFASDDDTWKVRGIPGSLYTASHASLDYAKVTAPYSGPPASWTTSANAEWITTPDGTDADGSPQEVPAFETDNEPNDWYWFETEFSLPMQYNNLRIELDEYAVDNNIALYLNSQVLSGNNTNLELSDWSWSTSMFSTLHYPGTIATNQSHYVIGNNTILVRVGNGGSASGNVSYLGLLLNAHVRGECAAEKRSLISMEEGNEGEGHGINVFPNPSAGKFTLISDGEMTHALIRDPMGRIVESYNGINSNTLDITLDNTVEGIYLIEVSTAGRAGILYKKIVIQ